VTRPDPTREKKFLKDLLHSIKYTMSSCKWYLCTRRDISQTHARNSNVRCILLNYDQRAGHWYGFVVLAAPFTEDFVRRELGIPPAQDDCDTTIFTNRIPDIVYRFIELWVNPSLTKYSYSCDPTVWYRKRHPFRSDRYRVETY